MLDQKTESNLARVVDEARRTFADELVSVVLYGSATGDDFRPPRSDLNLAIVVEAIRISHLEALSRWLPTWHERGVATPLFIDRAFLAGAGAVFPMEVLDIQAEHRVLSGADVFAAISVDAEDLRRQLEYEARTKLLRLRVEFAQAGGSEKRLQPLMLESVKSFAALMRALLRLRRVAVPRGLAAGLDAFERAFDARLGAVREVLAVKVGTADWRRGAVDAFAAYLADVETLVALAEKCCAPPAAPAGESGS